MGKRMSRSAMLVLVLSIFAAPASPPRAAASDAVSPGDALIGEWWTENNEGRIRFTRDKDGTYRGTTTCCVPATPTKDHPARDLYNPNPKLRGRSTVGIVLIWKLTYEDGEYNDGYVYNPRDGDTYRFEAKILDRNTLKIRGYMGIPLLGQSQIWKRVRVETKR
jgi:uncharacterized protein (DUF2147 family)